jgi:uncharacterized protein YndB with AHSA1/START domain
MAINETLEVAIGRPPTEVFNALLAIEEWPAWLIASGVVAVARIGEPPGSAIRVGSRLAITQQVAGRSAQLEATVAAVEPPGRLSIGGRSGDGIAVDIEAGVAADGTGSRLRWTIRIGLPFRYRFFESMAAPQVARAAALDLDALRRRLESTARP